MIKINNLKMLNSFLGTNELDRNLHEYIKSIFEKTREVLKEDVIQVILNGDCDEFQDFDLKWEREVTISKVKYEETFFKNKGQGIIIINRKEK